MNKPVPDIEQLKYKGTKDKPDIKIFVSHRIDQDSATIDNPLYIPVRCGAAFDERENIEILGDDTGENISQKRLEYGELTVQYWAWKNVNADYYGLCHYRRYLSYGNVKKVNRNAFRMIEEVAISEKTINRHNLSNIGKMRDVIDQYDVIYGEGTNVKNITWFGREIQSVRKLWEAHDSIFFEKKWIDVIIDIIKNKVPEYYESAVSYFLSDYHIGFNCYILKREYFYKLCKFQFLLLNELEEKVLAEKYEGMKQRTLGYMGEILYGIFIYHILHSQNIKIKCLPIVFFKTTTPLNGRFDWYRRWFHYKSIIIANRAISLIFPIASNRRFRLRMLVNTIRGDR